MTESNKEKLIWNQLAAWWADNIGDGDVFHQAYVFPDILQLAKLTDKHNVLEIGCGSGALTRQLAKSGCNITANDFSENFIAIAKQKPLPNVEYDVYDATSLEDLGHLVTKGPFDCVIASMVLHDMGTLEPLYAQLPQLLTPDGYFIFSIPHPCFNAERVSLNFYDSPPHIALSNYSKAYSGTLKSKPGQPIEQYVFHRPLNQLFGPLFSQGFILDHLLEPTSCELSKVPDTAWKHLPEIPPVMICRWRKERGNG